MLADITKTKGYKVRASIFNICEEILLNYADKSDFSYIEKKIKLLSHQNNMKGILQFASKDLTSQQLTAFLLKEKERGLYQTYHRISYALDSLKLMGEKYILMQFKKKPEMELVKFLQRINIIQAKKIVNGAGIFKDKFYTCLSHVAFRRQLEDQQWLEVEDKARDIIE